MKRCVKIVKRNDGIKEGYQISYVREEPALDLSPEPVEKVCAYESGFGDLPSGRINDWLQREIL